MADRLLIGLSKTVVEGALAKVQSAIEEDPKLRQKAQRNLVLISLELEMMQSFLNVAREEIIIKNNLVGTWVRHVRELAYDLEDCVEFVVHLDDKPIFWRRLLPSCMVSPLPLDQAVIEIEDLKGRAEELSKCYLRYSSISDSAGFKLVMVQQQASSRAVAITASNMLAEARGAARRGKGLRDLAQLINKKDHKLQVISVWGTGGDHGMTPIIREAYNDQEICKNSVCRAWVKLKHPFNPHEFVRGFMAQVYANSCEEEGADVPGVDVLMKMKVKHGHLLNEFRHEVSRTYLVVLENLTNMVDWDAVRTFLPDRNNGSRIIVSTQQHEIASLCVGRSYKIMELKQFTAEHSVCALFKEGSQDYREDKNQMMCHANLNLSSSREISSLERKAVKQWMCSHPLTGRDSQINELRRYTARARFYNCPVISVWGIPGIGKSALVRNLYYDRMIHTMQFDKYRWVDVSHPFNLRDFCRSLLSDVHSEKDPTEECRHELLEKHSCLIVIDSLRSKEEWDLIKSALVSRVTRSVIIVITTEPYVTTDEDQVYNVRGLEAAAAFDLFRNEVRRINPGSPLNDHHLEIGAMQSLKNCFHNRCDAELEELILKCGGLPEVIVSIATLLATRTVTLMDTIWSLNKKFMHHLETELEYDGLQTLFDWLHSYFRASPDFLKPCIFYLSIFPRDQVIRRRRLIRRWIAEGYSRDNDGKSAEEREENLFSQLIDLTIIQPPPQETTTTAVGNTKMALCQVNGFIREYIVSQQVEENLVLELGSSCVLTSQRTGRHLVILESWDRDIIVYKSIDFSRLRSLTVFGNWEPFFISKVIKTLRVLDLEDASGITDSDLEKMVKLLPRLKFLSLRGQREICHLPSSLGDLRQLQTLDVRGTSIGALPESITKLQKLQYVRAGTKDVPTLIVPASSSWLPKFRKHCLLGVQVPSGIGILRGLHTLGVVNVVASGGKAMVEEIKKLTQLHKLGVSGINKHNSRVFFSAISSHVHLESLLVRLDKDNQCYLVDISLPENLQSLKLYGLQDKLPLSRSHLRTLMKLTLEMDTLKKNDMEFLSNLPELCILRLRVKQQLQGGRLHFYAEMCGEQLPTFEKVKILEIACSSGELHVTFGSESMRNLEVLELDYSSASYQLAGLNNLSELKQVLLKGTDDEEFRTQFASHLANHPNRPVVKLEELPRSS